MRINKQAVKEALAASQDGLHAARDYARAKGYKFRNASFDEIAIGIRHAADLLTAPEQPAPEQPEPQPIVGGQLRAPDERRPRTTARTLVFTCAQNNTLLHAAFWKSLMNFCDYKGAELHVARITYNKSTQSAGMAKPGSAKASDQDELWYDPAIVPYISDESMQITDDLVWCGELNILPTRSNPLSTLKTYTRQASGIVPHAKMLMDSLPVMPDHRNRFMYTTGTVTQRNYIQKAAGQVAEFHHVFGALVVEVDGDNWWVRQLNADHEGVFYDKTSRYSPDGVSHGHPVEAMVHGDIHIGKANRTILRQAFGPGGIVDQLRPAHQFFHDIVDFTPRNHHNIKDPHFRWSDEAAITVEQEFKDAVALLSDASRHWSKLHVVVSNHDQAIGLWLRNVDGFNDPANRHFWLEMNLHVSGRLRTGAKPCPFWNAMVRQMDGPLRSTVDVIGETDSLVLDGIEYGLHGHLGPNGARGSPKNLSVIGKAFTAHTHSAGIVEGVYTVGVYGKLDMGYNKGPSSWSHTFGVTYPNGKRALFTINPTGPWRNYATA